MNLVKHLALPVSAIDFVPHDAPMCLINLIIGYQSESVVTQTHITQNSLFCHNGHVPVWVGIEYMAQSAAAWAGYGARLNTDRANAKPPIGYLLGTRDYSVTCNEFDVGDTLIVYADCILQSSEGLGSFDCRIERDNQILARARLSVLQPLDNPPESYIDYKI